MQLPHDHGQADKFDHMPREENFAVIANVFKLLSDRNRTLIFWLLCHCEQCVLNLSAMVEMSSPAVSHHLRQLKDAGLIVSRREGKEVYYTAADTQLVDLLHHAIEHMEKIACPNHR